MKSISTVLFSLMAYFVFAQLPIDTSKAPSNWFNLDPETDKVNGVGSDRTYKELLKDKTSTPVIVGVIDSGVDFNHEDLKDVMWVNTKEIPGNNIDDDKNGYADDIHGWNFLGGKDGKNVENETLELTRIYREQNKKFEGKDEKNLNADEKKEFAYYQKIKAAFDKKVSEANQQFTQFNFIKQLFESENSAIKEQLHIDTVKAADLEKYKPKDQKDEQVLIIVRQIMGQEKDATLESLLKQFSGYADYFGNQVKYNLNPEFDPRNIIGDDYSNDKQRDYGNPDCNGPASLHGTHVAGIIGANRKNSIGIKGVADNVKIMAVRAIPDGDERDKDVANAIFYAVDNGAKVINMSFGKMYPYDKEIVDQAVRYAESKDVLIVHAAGNDGIDIDTATHFPCKKFLNGKEAKNWLDIGALNWRQQTRLPAQFSNFGKKTVNIFAPGVDIYSTKTGGGYLNESGTSMACPVTAGVAAVIRSYFPDLTAVQVKDIILKSCESDHKKDLVDKPGKIRFAVKKGDSIKSICKKYKISEDDIYTMNPGLKEKFGPGEIITINGFVKFGTLSQTGGFVNLYKAVQLAMKISKSKSVKGNNPKG